MVVDARAIDDPQQRRGAFGQVAGWAAQLDGVVNAQGLATNTAATIVITPTTGAGDVATEH